MSVPLNNPQVPADGHAPSLEDSERQRLAGLKRRLHRDHVGGAHDGALTSWQWAQLAFLRWRYRVRCEHREPGPLTPLDDMAGVASGLLAYVPTGKAEAVKRYTDPDTGIEIDCVMPNLVYRGYCKHQGQQWRAEWCVWIPNWLDEWFGKHAARRLLLMRWLVRARRYAEDITLDRVRSADVG